jgi:hypothetical protein
MEADRIMKKGDEKFDEKGRYHIPFKGDYWNVAISPNGARLRP